MLYSKVIDSDSRITELQWNYRITYTTKCNYEFFFFSDKTFTILMESNSYYFKCVARHKAFLNISSTSKVSTVSIDML